MISKEIISRVRLTREFYCPECNSFSDYTTIVNDINDKRKDVCIFCYSTEIINPDYYKESYYLEYEKEFQDKELRNHIETKSMKRTILKRIIWIYTFLFSICSIIFIPFAIYLIYKYFSIDKNKKIETKIRKERLKREKRITRYIMTLSEPNMIVKSDKKNNRPVIIYVITWILVVIIVLIFTYLSTYIIYYGVG